MTEFVEPYLVIADTPLGYIRKIARCRQLHSFSGANSDAADLTTGEMMRRTIFMPVQRTDRISIGLRPNREAIVQLNHSCPIQSPTRLFGSSEHGDRCRTIFHQFMMLIVPRCCRAIFRALTPAARVVRFSLSRQKSHPCNGHRPRFRMSTNGPIP
jgi:hypothetical protein